ncbi:Signal peptide peptidase 1 [Ceratocystis fimbriata CBS 114723]|uniref:Signal peptide peptidase 1 n=1 Tax=Ceratocystis fimbriata CBS 114723 TaxID=1035309 RepID=A0A2C5WXZ4_9PEZI|nr:Signal peptide peptidase 1 [Ceratocystis fimbriata CBS 114723]
MPSSSEIAGIVDLLIQLVGGASLCIYIGAHSSLARPPSASPHSPTRSSASGSESDSDDDDADEYDPALQAGLDASDAVLLPILSALVLYGMYCLLKYLDDPTLLSRIVRGYICIVSLVSVTATLSQALILATSLIFPRIWRARDGTLYEVCPEKSGHIRLMQSGPGGSVYRGVVGPLPFGICGEAIGSQGQALSEGILVQYLWALRDVLTQKWRLSIIVTRGLPMRERVTLRIQHIAGLVLAVATVAGYHFTNSVSLSNLIAVCLCHMTFSILSPTTFVTGSLVLMGLFVYDIVMVFYTPLMITVATKLDAPIKLVASTAGRKGSMLGLGDIVVPGIVMAMALRFDLWRHYAKKIKYETVELKTTTASPSTEELADPSIILTSQQRTMATKARYISVANKWGDWLWTLPSIFGRSSSSAMAPLPLSLSGTQFSKTYFAASMIGYVAGLLAAMGCMLVFKHGQPALLYLVPAVLGAVWGTGTLRGEIGLMLKYTEDGSLDTKERIVEVDADGRPVQSEEERKRNEEKTKEHDMKTRTRKPGKDILVFKITQVAIKTKRK